jgi:glycosyltransferase involved in cell wall biosynthesis
VRHIAFDGRFIKPEHPDGISRFSLGLISELAKLTKLQVIVCDQKVADKLPDSIELIWAGDPTSPLEIFTALKLNSKGIDVLFSPMQTTSGFGRKFKLVLTLHDLIYYRHRTPPREFNPLVRMVWWLYHLSFGPQRLVLNGSDAVVTVSETTKQQMLAKRLTKRPITVIYNAADAPTEVPVRDNSNSRTLVYMGSFIGYKNVEALIAGMAQLPDHTLVCLSRITDQRRAELASLADQLGAKVQFENGVSESEYHNWLLQAQALVTASLDEGFGIPVIEAMERGTPTVISNLEIFEEIGQGAALFFDPEQPESFAMQVASLGESAVWEEVSQKSIRQAAQFSWKSSAARLLELLNRV